ncbi:hypothetical protein [Streptomyces subrutilus]|uniref:hypothetical protein n=1 Tax=Streptomyces subrutilus TaxID=36818 RepID=UPI002E110FD3|nr:hypothetical protein OG479_32890 [Streptomyces subrutilus]
MTSARLTRGQQCILAATAIPMIGAGTAGGIGTYTNIRAELGRSETALGVVAAGEGVALILALLVVGLTMLGQAVPAVVRAGLWTAPIAASATGIITADDLTEAAVYAITPMAMSVAAEGLGLLARRIVTHRTGVDAEALRRNAETVQRLATLRAMATSHPSATVRWMSERRAWRLIRRVGVGDAQLGTQLVGVQRDRLHDGADAALVSMLGGTAAPALPPVQPQPETGFETAADEAVAVTAPLQPDPPHPPAAPPSDAPPQPDAAASATGHSPDAADTEAAPDAQPVATIPDPDADAQLLAAAAELNAAALAATGRPASLRALQTSLGIGQRRAQRIQQRLPKKAS